MGLVSTWLNGIGLSHAVPSFQAAGIVTPSALAKLELVHYEALGVKEPNDRKKLFYLVQRIKMAVDEDDDSDSIIEQVDRLEDTHPVRSRNNKSSPASVERYDYQENTQSPQRSQNDSGSHLDEDDYTELDSHQYDVEGDRRRSSRGIAGSSRRKKGSTANDSGLSAASYDSYDNKHTRSTRSSKRLDASKENKRALERKSLSSRSLKSEAEEKVSKLTKLVNRKPRTYHTSIKSKTNGDNDNEFEEDAVTSSRTSLKESREKKAESGSGRRSLARTGSGKVSSERKSDRRLSEQLSKSKIFADHDSVEISFEDINAVDTSSGLDIAKSESYSSTNKNKRQSLPAAGRGVSSNGEKVRRSSISSASSVDTMSESENGSDFGASQTSLFFKKMEKKKEPKPQNGRKTEVQTQSNKGRYESKLQNPAISGRAGSKGLSTIPSEEAAIMSPLVKLTSSQLEETAIPGSVTRDKKNRTRASTGSQSSLMSKSFDSAVISGSDSDSRPSSRRSIQPPSASGRRDQASVQSSVSSAASGRSGVSSLTKEKMDRSKSPQMVRASPKSGIAQPTARRNNRERSRSRSPVRQSPSRDRFLRGNTKSFDDRSDTGASTDQMSSKVFVHGMPDDTSWNAQVSRLREASEVEHSEQLYNEGHVVDEEEMRIRVIVRKRPMSKREASTSDAVDVIHPLTYNNYGRVLVYQPKTRVDLTKEIETLPFAFDNVFDELSSNLDIYDSTVRNLIPGVFDGKWASVFAYGQTGSGKTFTMMGSGLTGKKAGNQRDNDSENFGLYYLAAQDLFKQANQRRNQHISVGASLFEIYGGKLFDLLNNRHPIKCLEDQKGKVCFPGLSEHPVSDADELMSVIEQGALNRSTGTTSANADSSRSHAVLQLSLRKQVGRQSNVEHARLSFIDLAGSERGADTDKASRTTRLEGAEINTSLLALKEVIRALATGGKMGHIPFRGSKLTQVLKQGFVGKNSRTVMVSCVAPNLSNCEHTLNTLRYADRVKERNAETGQLVGAAAASIVKTSKSATTPTGNSSRPAHSSFSETENIDDEEDDGSNEEMDVNGSYSMEELVSEDEEDDSLVLNNILSQTSPKSSPTRSGQKLKKQNNTEYISSKKKAAQALIETHRTVMTGMLGIVKHEMTLVNTTDADRDKIEDYLVDLETVHDEQLSMLSSLRESLLEYYGSRDSTRPRRSEIADISGVLSDGSFEDLRD